MEHAKAGFTYTLETVKNGQVIDKEVVHNLIPVEGINYLINTGLKAGAAFPAFYVGLFEGAYTPLPADTMATFPAAATELVAYAETTRRALVLGAVSAGAVDNVASKAEFTGTTNGKLAHGGFICSAPAKGAATGVLISAVRFTSPKTLDAGTVLRVTGGFQITSA